MAKSKKAEEKKQVNPAPEQQEQGQEKEAAQPVAENVTLTTEEFNQVKAHIETLQKEKDEAIGLAQRLQADFDNYRKRNATLRADSYDDGVRECIKELIPTLDNFDRALENAIGVEPKFLEGIQLVQRTLLDALHKVGLQEIPAEGQFDPNLHNAVMQEEAQGRKSGEILEVFQKGYEVKGKILRHTMVKVAQ